MPNPTLKLHRGVYVVQTIENGRRIRRSLGTSDKAEAERRLSHIKLTNAIIDRERAKTVKELFEDYASHLHNTNKSEKRWRKIWKYLSPTFADTYPQYITPEICSNYCKTRGVSTGTLNLELGLLRSILKHAYKHRLIPHAIFIPVPRKPAPRTDYINKADFKRILDQVPTHHVKLFLILAVTTGARSNAILDLTWNRVDLQRRIIDLRKDRTTSNKGRAVVPINDTALRYLTEAHPLRRTQYVIEYKDNRVRSIGHTITKAGSRVGIKLSPHMLRHSAAVWMAEGGVPMSEIAQFLGHSNTAITERVYARYSPGYLLKAASHLEIE